MVLIIRRWVGSRDLQRPAARGISERHSGAGFGGDSSGAVHARQQLMRRKHDAEIDGAGVEKEIDDSIEEFADVDLSGGNVVGRERVGHSGVVQHGHVDDPGGEVRRTNDGRDEGSKDISGE